ncbi:MAG: hypothetical protein O3C60_16325 [Planctomycetota bacterium]|nr:hypothetical protein [Planctomycetota bacterium]
MQAIHLRERMGKTLAQQEPISGASMGIGDGVAGPWPLLAPHAELVCYTACWSGGTGIQ